MAKKLSNSRACAAKTLFYALQSIKAAGGSMPLRDILTSVEQNIEFTDWEKERAGKMQYIRWQTMLQFYSIDFCKAGFLVKKDGLWYITPEGEAMLSHSPEDVLIQANTAYRAWRSEHEDDPSTEVDATDATDTTKSTLINLENLEADALTGIKNHIYSKNAYEFQDMAGALLRAMGYHTPFIAPKGKDGGIDIVAYVDPLGAQTPRIKVQVKRYKEDSTVGSPEIDALAGVLRTGDIGLFITTSHFSSDAKAHAASKEKFLRLIDIDEFIDLWEQYYDKMPDDDKNLLPLKRIAFVGSNE